MYKKVILTCFLLSSLFITAQDSSDSNSETKNTSWSFLVEPYLMFPNMKGDTQIRENLPSLGVDADTDNIFSHLKMGAMLYLEAKNENWAITSDFVYMKLGEDVTPSSLVQSGELEVKETLWELDGYRRILPMLEAGIGMRLVSVSADADFSFVFQDRSADITETWIDPIIVIRSHNVIKDNFLLNVKGDIGGFGIGSEFTWQIQLDAGYKFSDLFNLMIGYRYIGIDYETGSGQDYFAYNIDTFGPEIRLGFNF
ncbi:hypothetical protein [Xanthomarina spongicola]|uniref:Outer membrane protein with beta-barrel domain n=1 Tax=Xanthomarina spongicola TaxID=570520 RepID=A0A316DIV9_9FLAO|nr:hypothetical protein [Xanthomarina spongicola]PWK18187.1 hypothetical protein LX78_02096 [Xanthomarina spongicola]